MRIERELLEEYKELLNDLILGWDSLGAAGLCNFLDMRTNNSISFSFMRVVMQELDYSGEEYLSFETLGIFGCKRRFLAVQTINLINTILSNTDETSICLDEIRKYVYLLNQGRNLGERSGESVQNQ